MRHTRKAVFDTTTSLREPVEDLSAPNITDLIDNSTLRLHTHTKASFPDRKATSGYALIAALKSLSLLPFRSSRLTFCGKVTLHLSQ